MKKMDCDKCNRMRADKYRDFLLVNLSALQVVLYAETNFKI